MKRYALGISIILFVAALLLVSSSGFAYNDYTGSQCSNCHSGFESKGALHDVHTAFISNCSMCHPTNPGSKPVNTSSANDATAFSCLGCHGRDYGGTDGMQAAGLRVFHASKGVTVCAGCHPSDPSPALGENILPAHYGRSDVTLTTACLDNLDNDGDGVRDGSDPDCQVPAETSTWGRVKALYRN